MLRILRKVLRAFAFLILGLAVAAGILYAAGLRVVFYGGGEFRFEFLKSASKQAAEIEKHREAQRAQAPPEAPAPPEPQPAAPSAAPAIETPSPAAVKASSHWTNFRGPDRDGHYRQQPVRTDWGPALKPIWKQPVGGGYGSFVVAEGRAFTIEQRGERELAAAYDVKTGRELWTSAWNAHFSGSPGGGGPRATPTWHDGRVFVLGVTGEFRALDAATGRVLWRTNILADAGAANADHGIAASPLIVDNTVVVQPGGGNGQSVVAYDHQSGKRVWGALDDRAAYSSPMLVTLAGVRQILAHTDMRLVGLSPENGTLLWEFPWQTPNAAQPLITAPNRVFISEMTDAALLELSVGADGKLTPRDLWHTTRMNHYFTSPVLHDGFIYGLDEAILSCIDASTGDLKWKGGRYGYGQVMLASGHLFVLTEEGELALVRADPSAHQEITRFPAIEGKTWNHPAMSDGILLIRNIEEMAAFDLRK
ncbi:MAG TPA: PQQ-binding-like beta-propeller repeat protein [Vicinamibacterales bacterium]